MTAIYKVLGQEAPAVTTEVSLYAVPAAPVSAIGSTLVIANISASTASATVRVRPAGISATNKHIIVPAVEIKAHSLLTLTLGITLAGTDVVSVQSSAANAFAFSLFGTEI